MKLPDLDGLTVAYDTEGSGLFVDDGARISAVSFAFRDPATNAIRSAAVAFDQGYEQEWLPCGMKELPSNHLKRIMKWTPEDRTCTENRSEAVWHHLHRWLLRQRLVMHHGKHDCHQARVGLRNSPGTGYDLMDNVVADTMLTAGVLWPRESVALKNMAVRLHLGQELGIHEGAEADEQEALGPWKGPENDPRFDLIPWPVLKPYSRLDAELTLIAHEFEIDQDTDAAQRSAIALDLRLARLLYRMERRGVGLDVPGMRAEAAKLAAMIEEAGHRVPFKGGTGRPTPPAAVAYFFGPASKGGLELLPYDDKMTKGGKVKGPQPQVDEEVITRLTKLGAPGAAEYGEYAGLKAGYEKWYLPWPAMCGQDGRIRTTHKQGTVVSGRLAVERWQAQAMPHDYQIPAGLLPPRYFIEPDTDESEAWEADCSQAEIRIATAVAKEKNMYRALKNGVDSHDAATMLMFFQGRKLAEVKDRDDDWEQRRQVAKRCNLGILYGIGAKGLQTQIAKFTGIEYSVPQCSEWIADWKRAFPAFSQALYQYSQLAQTQGFVRLSTGRIRKFSEYEPVHKAFNQRIQSEVAEAAKRVMLRFDERYPDMILLQIHDSIVARIPKGQVAEVTQAMRDIMVEVFSQMYAPVPFKADCKPFGRLAYASKLEEVAA
jgi:DNA polymerase I-like protein with 3'-5' exonuclease and polymerase domains